MVIEIVLTIELVFSTKLARKSVGTFSMESDEWISTLLQHVLPARRLYLRLLVTLQMLISSERFVAVGVVTLAHCLSYNVV